MSIVGYYIDCDTAICSACYRAKPGIVLHSEWADTNPISADTETDTPEHCAECGTLIPSAWTGYAIEYARQAIQDYIDTLIGTPSILRQWAERLDALGELEDPDGELRHHLDIAAIDPADLGHQATLFETVNAEAIQHDATTLRSLGSISA